MKLTGPTSLRGRVTAGVLALLAVLLVVLFVLVDLVLGARLQADLRTRLSDRAALAAQLDPSLSAQQLVDQLRGSGIVAQLCTEGLGCVVADPAPPPPGELSPPSGPRAKGGRVPGPKRTAAPVQQDGNVLYVRTTLASGRQLTLSIDDSAVSSAISRLIVLETVGGLATLLLAWLLLGWVVGTALRPLDRMTSLASAIAGGQRGRRLGTGEPSTELGRTAHAFDAMLDELESALETAREAETTMRGFLSDASHELRTPLAGVQATAENLLRSDPSRAEREAALAALLGESARAGRLVDDLLTASRGAAGVSLRLEPTDLGALVDHEVQRYRMLAPDLTWEQSPPTVAGDDVPPAVVTADPQRLGQVLSNLLENAHRATPAGGVVTITISSAADVVTAEVTDTGPGIPARDLERIFERFVRLDPSRSRHSGGAGLGLPIARTIAAAHGGTLTALPGPGGRFRLTLPRAATDWHAPAPQSADPL